MKIIKRKAFTILEVFIVILIIGILINLSIPSLIQIQRKAQSVEAKMFLRTCADAAWVYYLENKSFPSQEPDYSIPSDLGVSDIASEYFDFIYTNDGTFITLTAAYKDMATTPIGYICSYYVIYRKTAPPEVYEGSYRKMDEDWYIWFCHMEKNQLPMMTPGAGWP
jgi:type II secretory pathway pseudopilin PulG